MPKDPQITSKVMMVRPFAFGYNPETAGNNFFQKAPEQDADQADMSKRAQTEFDQLVAALRKAGVQVIVFQDDAYPHTPDAVFPNNWVSFHEDGRIAVYPMFAPSRRGERREEMFDIIADDFHFDVQELEDFTHFEEQNIFLEGTGSLVLDRKNKIAYAAASDRTDIHAFETFCDRFDYEGIVFTALQTVDGELKKIYHTNVMMSIGTSFAVICINTIHDTRDRNAVKSALKESGRKLIEISEAQMNQFAGNVLCLEGKDGEICVMSSRAYGSLRPDQIDLIAKYATIVHVPLDTIEKLGGGSARCMIAEIFLPQTN
jgi:hypothetical protein